MSEERTSIEKRRFPGGIASMRAAACGEPENYLGMLAVGRHGGRWRRPVKILLSIIGLMLCPALLTSSYGHESANEESDGLGSVHFGASCNGDAQPLFDRGVASLHNFYFAEAKRSFNAAIERDPKCGIGYWGLSMTTLGNWLVNPPTAKTTTDAGELLRKGIEVGAGTQRERDFMSALQVLFADAETRDYRSRSLAYEKAMERLYGRYPDDPEAASFYALTLNITALPTDKTFSNQLKAAEILDRVARTLPDHPGVLHYLIHSLDYPALALRALPAAKRYAEVAPAAPHALHMPSHTYSMLGQWENSIRSNKIALQAAADAMAKKLATQPALNGAVAHYNDFNIYAELQLARDGEARRIVDESIAYQHAHDTTKDAIYIQTGFAAIPARYILERKAWAEAGDLVIIQNTWAYAEAMIRFTRALGAAHIRNFAAAGEEIESLTALRKTAAKAGQDYWDGQIEVLGLAASAWLAHAQGRESQALPLMQRAADLEDASEKHIAMENRLYPMRELLADLLLEVGQPAQALIEYETSLIATPNRFNGYYGAARAANAAGDRARATAYFAKLLALCGNADSRRREIEEARQFIAMK